MRKLDLFVGFNQLLYDYFETERQIVFKYNIIASGKDILEPKQSAGCYYINKINQDEMRLHMKLFKQL